MKLMPHQNATRGLSELYVWRPEYIYEMNMDWKANNNLLAGIAIDIRRDVCARVEKKQE